MDIEEDTNVTMPVFKSPSDDLLELVKKKTEIESKLINMERQIFNLEENYLAETSNCGNLVKGWDSYLSNKMPITTKRTKVRDIDRIFSLSSTTSFKNNNSSDPLYLQELKDKGAMLTNSL